MEEMLQDGSRYPKLIAQGSIIRVDYVVTDSLNQISTYTELFMLAHISPKEYSLISLASGNRWKESFNSNNTANMELVPAELVIENLQSSIAEVVKVEVLGHISEIDFYNQMG